MNAKRARAAGRHLLSGGVEGATAKGSALLIADNKKASVATNELNRISTVIPSEQSLNNF